MGVKVGSARVDENGKAHGGLAGDQTGKEISTQSWYKHAKGWRVVRPLMPSIAEKIATAMKVACDNPHIGYDQYNRDSLLKLSANVTPKYFPGSVTTNCETDCSALVRVCTAYAFGKDIIGEVIGTTRFSTANQVKFMVKTGHFIEMVGSKYTDSPDYLKRGDILVTKTQGHTVVVLNDGPMAVDDVIEIDGVMVRSEIKKGMKGEDVRFLQECLVSMGFELPRFGCDGDFGGETYNAVVKFQQGNVDDMQIGIVDVNCWKTIEKYINDRVAARLASITRTLHAGDKGEDVRIMQECLVAAGYEFPKYGCDGDFGGETRDTVYGFQKNNNIPTTGGFDELTKSTLVEVLKSGKML